MKKTASIVAFAVIAVCIVALGIWFNAKSDESMSKSEASSNAAAQETQTKIMQNLKINDVVMGTGKEAENGDMVTVNYVGTLDDGTKFDSSYDRNQPFSFLLGANKVIKGWDLGILGMKVGGKREFTIPPELGYGSGGFPDGHGGYAIPPNATLHFTVELLSVEAPTGTVPGASGQ